MKLSERKVLRKKEQILLSAINIINQKGYSGTTMEEVASELLMTKGSLYYYFKNKSDLMYQCHNFVLSQATKDLESILEDGGPVKDVLKKMIETHITYAIDEKETFNLIMEPKRFFNEEQLELVLKLRNHYEGLFDEIIQRGIEVDEFHAEEPKIARMIILGAMNWVQQWYRPEGRLSKEDLITLYSDYILKILE
ncbi:TetR family transcriptional regulator [Thalassobacillus devorans]|uniref:TetR family transcriptional regulator n=1 Tax=Thalassobacillus devorans TaxID=279813 RepID=A0ABQ1P3C2_9BACI|nr:TetR/AcrR family transcriptional regulator [Thalassobacillus devorans]NIK28022.1 AcrR family transcriptional regulator [Thalassobacillus devorans]GGC89519.1 TetR family transcriptional regulator [Thalassobacillus devorans]